MIREAIDRILDLGRVEQLSIDGRPYTSKKLEPVRDPHPDVLHVGTLTGLLDYLRSNFDIIDVPFKIHVRNECEVVVIDVVSGHFKQRCYRLKAMHSEPSTFRPGTYYNLEEFCILLRTAFVPSQTIDELIRLFGNIKGESVMQWSDDGISQSVQSRKGIALVENVPIPSVVELKPYRVFREIDQPLSPFIVRAKAKDGSPPSVALFEGGGEQWKLDAMQGIKGYLQERLPEGTIILA
jgi:hypothetical protein